MNIFKRSWVGEDQEGLPVCGGREEELGQQKLPCPANVRITALLGQYSSLHGNLPSLNHTGHFAVL